MSFPSRFLVVCRNVADYEAKRTPVPASHEIRECEICHRKIAVSQEAREQSGRGGICVCNPCGFEMLRRLQQSGKDVEVRENPAATAQRTRRERDAR